MYFYLIWNFDKNVKFGLIAGFFIKYIICLANQKTNLKSWVENCLSNQDFVYV